MPKGKTDYFLKAKEYAFLLLKFRLRSEKEIDERLRRKKFPEQAVKETIVFLKEKRFIDDIAFTKAWVNSRLRQHLGLRRIRQELRQKGIAKEIIDAKIEEVKSDYSESEIIEKIVEGRLERLKGVEQVKVKSRIYAYLARRGFSPELIIDALNKLCKQIS